MPQKYYGIYDQAMTGRHPLAAIRAKCMDCMNGQEAEVRRYEIATCPLRSYRMGRMESVSAPGADSSSIRLEKAEEAEAA